MILNSNITHNIGDTIYLETSLLAGAQIGFTTITDSITGTTATCFFNKFFRYSIDGGIIYTDWMTLDATNVKTIKDDSNAGNSLGYSTNKNFIIQFKYVRSGTDNVSDLSLESITLGGATTYNVIDYKPFITSKDTIFDDIINGDIDVFTFAQNLVEKVYETGIIPEYVTRQDEENLGLYADLDYIDFWRTLSEFFVLIFKYALNFSNIYWKRGMLASYLEQRNIIISNNPDLIEMQRIASEYYSSIYERGTVEVFRKKGYQYPVGYHWSWDLPIGYTVSPSTPIWIDGIWYNELENLPFGWNIVNGKLVNSDTNYHTIELSNQEVRTYYIVENALNDEDNFVQDSTDTNLLYDVNNVERYEINNPTLTAPVIADESYVLKNKNGEYLRLICFNEETDEFIYNNVNIKDLSWNIGNSSPMYKGLDNQFGTLVKAYEDSMDFVSIDKYPWFGFTGGGSPVPQNEFYNAPSACPPVTLENYEFINEGGVDLLELWFDLKGATSITVLYSTLGSGDNWVEYDATSSPVKLPLITLEDYELTMIRNCDDDEFISTPVYYKIPYNPTCPVPAFTANSVVDYNHAKFNYILQSGQDYIEVKVTAPNSGEEAITRYKASDNPTPLTVYINNVGAGIYNISARGVCDAINGKVSDWSSPVPTTIAASSCLPPTNIFSTDVITSPDVCNITMTNVWTEYTDESITVHYNFSPIPKKAYLQCVNVNTGELKSMNSDIGEVPQYLALLDPYAGQFNIIGLNRSTSYDITIIPYCDNDIPSVPKTIRSQTSPISGDYRVVRRAILPRSL